MNESSALRALDVLIEELTVDCYGDDEQLSGLLVGAQDALQPGEPARIVGVEVRVEKIDTGPDERTGLTARVRRDRTSYEVALADLEFTAPSELGRVVGAYRRWQGRPPYIRPARA
jgi:hypothetical protein